MFSNIPNPFFVSNIFPTSRCAVWPFRWEMLKCELSTPAIRQSPSWSQRPPPVMPVQEPNSNLARRVAHPMDGMTWLIYCWWLIYGLEPPTIWKISGNHCIDTCTMLIHTLCMGFCSWKLSAAQRDIQEKRKARRRKRKECQRIPAKNNTLITFLPGICTHRDLANWAVSILG